MRTYRWLAIPVIAVALVATACGGDEDTSDGDATTEATTEATSTAGDVTATTEATTGSTSGGDDVDLAAIFGGFATASFNITYQMEGDSADEAMDGVWTWIQDSGGERTRFEATAEGQALVMITTPEQTVVCADGACFDASGAMGGAMPNIGDIFTEGIDDVQADASTATVTRVDGRNIAGTDTECVEFEDTAEGVNGTACYADGGIPLLIESTSAEGTVRMEATSYSPDVSDADFEAPFPITSLGG